jgi:C_GCAxxG_C_C family probable redox protein
MRRNEVAAGKFLEGYNCAQAVLYSFCDDLNLDKDTALRLACGFGAGIGRKEEVCGAVSGGIMALGIKYGRGENGERSLTEGTYQEVRKLMERFVKKHGTYICRSLLGGCELTDPEGQMEFKQKDLYNKVCKECVCSVVEIVEELMIEKSPV